MAKAMGRNRVVVADPDLPGPAEAADRAAADPGDGPDRGRPSPPEDTDADLTTIPPPR